MIRDPETGKNVLMFGQDSDVSNYKKTSFGAVQRALKGGSAREVLLPCGQCIGCRLDYSREWADRCVLEAKLWPYNWWATLTYDDEHLTTDEVIDLKTGEVAPAGILKPDDLTLFLKRLRRHWEYAHGHQGIRYYGCGEYGSKFHRPHFHVCLFNLPMFDLKHWYSRNGYATMTSEELSRIWGNGIVTVNELSWENAAYTARYMLKKAKGQEAEKWKASGLQQEFIRSSRDPGIGYGYYALHKEEIYKTDGVLIKGSLHSPPRYFDKLYQIENPEHWEEVQQRRLDKAERAYATWAGCGGTTLSYKAYLEAQERGKEETSKALARKMEMWD